MQWRVARQNTRVMWCMQRAIRLPRGGGRDGSGLNVIRERFRDGREKSAPAHARSLRLMRATVRAVSHVLAPGVLERIDGRGGAAADWVTRSPRVRESLRLEA